MVGDCVNKDDNDVMAGDIITVCQPAQQKRALPGLPSRLGSSSRERRAPKDWCIHLAFSLILPLYSHIQIFLCEPLWGGKHFNLFCRLYISITAWNGSTPSVHAGCCVIWLPTPNLWHNLKSIVFTTKPVPSLCLLSPLSVSPCTVSLHLFLPHPLSLFLPCLHLYLSYCRTQKERASWTSFMPFRTCASACRMRWMKWPPMARG